MKKMYRNFLIAASLLVAAGLVGYTAWFFLNPAPLTIQGEVDARYINVAGKIPGRILTVHVKKGDRVRKGQLLVELSSPEIQAKLGQAKAAGRMAASQKEKADRGARVEEINAARSNWQRAQVAADLAEKTYNRTARLYADGVVSAQKHDEAKANADAAGKQAEAALAVCSMAEKGARSEDKAAAGALAEQAANVVSEVSAYYGETRLVAPIDGEVVDVLAETGEMISAGYPVVRILDSSDFWMVFHVREDMLAGLKTGDTLKADIPALKEKAVPLKVVYVSALGDFAIWKATKTTGDFDLKTFEIHARPEKSLPSIRPGMSAIALWKKVSGSRKDFR